jgi:hypothetical protein
VLAHVAGIPVEEALLAAPALLAGVTVFAGYVRATGSDARRRLLLTGTPDAGGRCGLARPLTGTPDRCRPELARRRNRRGGSDDRSSA